MMMQAEAERERTNNQLLQILNGFREQCNEIGDHEETFRQTDINTEWRVVLSSVFLV